MSSQRPPAYQRELNHLRSLVNKLKHFESDDSKLIVLTRDLATKVRAFIARWENEPAIAGDEKILPNFRSILISFERQIEIMHMSTLTDLLEARND